MSSASKDVTETMKSTAPCSPSPLEVAVEFGLRTATHRMFRLIPGHSTARWAGKSRYARTYLSANIWNRGKLGCGRAGRLWHLLPITVP
jgi:hypothetical protein